MLVILTTVLCVSLAGLVALLGAKHWELATGRVLLPGARPELEALSRRSMVTFKRHVPAFTLALWRKFLFWVRISARQWLAHSLLIMEQTLEHALHTLRYGIEPSQHAKGQASQFLREVTEYKRRLMHQPLERRMIEED